MEAARRANGSQSRRAAVLVSLSAHVALGLLVVRVAPSSTDAAAPGQDALEITIVRTPPVAPAHAEQAEDPRAPAPRALAERVPSPRHAAAPHHARRHASAGEPAPSTVASIGEVTPTPPPGAVDTSPAPTEGSTGRECEPGTSGFLVPIDPLSVAVRALAPAMGGPGPAAGGGGDRPAGRQDDLEQSLRGSVRGPDVSRRPPPAIRPADDGGYDVEANRLSAHIAPDGRLTFRDGPPIEDPHLGAIPGNRETGAPGSIGAGFRFDLNDGLFDAIGQDPLRTERQWVLRETQELRDRLSARSRRVDEERSLIALSARLQEIAADRRLSAPQRRLAVFELWDDCATDAIGARARSAVEQFVRERFPAGTALAYTQAELIRLNRTRVTDRAFDPYRTAADAGPPDGGA